LVALSLGKANRPPGVVLHNFRSRLVGCKETAR
jgi:hypothetical protein